MILGQAETAQRTRTAGRPRRCGPYLLPRAERPARDAERIGEEQRPAGYRMRNPVQHGGTGGGHHAPEPRRPDARGSVPGRILQRPAHHRREPDAHHRGAPRVRTGHAPGHAGRCAVRYRPHPGGPAVAARGPPGLHRRRDVAAAAGPDAPDPVPGLRIVDYPRQHGCPAHGHVPRTDCRTAGHRSLQPGIRRRRPPGRGAWRITSPDARTGTSPRWKWASTSCSPSPWTSFTTGSRTS